MTVAKADRFVKRQRGTAPKVCRVHHWVARDLLEWLLDHAADRLEHEFTIGIAEREEIAEDLTAWTGRNVSEKAVANALGILSRPARDNGVELLIRVRRGRYMLNPKQYFAGRFNKHVEAIEDAQRIKTAKSIKAKNTKPKPEKKPAIVVPLSLVM